MKKQFIKISLVCAFLTLASQIKAQVTFGNNTPTLPGAIVQLKENNSQSGTAPNSIRGFEMPRVKLLQRRYTGTDLSSTVENSEDGPWNTSEHVGLTVYNTNTVSSSNQEDILCPGLYTWNGALWERQERRDCPETIPQPPPPTPQGVDITIDKSILKYESGANLTTVNNTQSAVVSWTPTTSAITSNISSYGTFSQIRFSTPILLNIPAPSPYTFMPQVEAMTSSDLINNIFLTKKSIVNFNIVDSKGVTKSVQLQLSQTNKELLVEDSKNPATYLAYSNISKTIGIKSNAIYNVSKSPANDGAIINAPTILSNLGSEVEDSNFVSTTLTFTPNLSSNQRYTYIIFADNNIPKRFSDVVYTITQCSRGSDLSMEAYKDLWEQMYGLNSGDEPDSNGDTTKNIHQVQWHRDQDNNIFFSAIFGTTRWMITNLAAKKYANGTPITRQAGPTTYTGKMWDYPSRTRVTANGVAASATAYNNMPRLGLLYNWNAAVNDNRTQINRGVSLYNRQGICPNGWIVPTVADGLALVNELTTRSTYYSTNTNSRLSGQTMKDACQAGGGQSLSILEGGFSMMLGGHYNGGSQYMERAGSIWLASTGFSGILTTVPGGINAQHLMVRDVSAIPSEDIINYNAEINASTGFSVRCIKK